MKTVRLREIRDSVKADQQPYTHTQLASFARKKWVPIQMPIQISPSPPPSLSLCRSFHTARKAGTRGKEASAKQFFRLFIRRARSDERDQASVSACESCLWWREADTGRTGECGRTSSSRRQNADKLATTTTANEGTRGGGEVAAENDKMVRHWPLAPHAKTYSRRRTTANKLFKSGALTCVGLIFLLSGAFIQTTAGAFGVLG